MFNNVLTLWLSAPSYSSNEQRCRVNTTQPLDKSLLITQTDGIVMVSGGLRWIVFSPIWLNKLSLSQRGLSVALFLLMGLSLPSILLALYEEAMCVWLNSVLRAEKAAAHSHLILWCLLSSVKLPYTAPLGCLLIFTWLLSALCSALNYLWQAYPSTSCLDTWSVSLCHPGWHIPSISFKPGLSGSKGFVSQLKYYLLVYIFSFLVEPLLLWDKSCYRIWINKDALS